jgi:hypothetical protein
MVQKDKRKPLSKADFIRATACTTSRVSIADNLVNESSFIKRIMRVHSGLLPVESVLFERPPSTAGLAV